MFRGERPRARSEVELPKENGLIIVTGGAGFIGSNLVKTLNEKGRSDLVVVDDMRDGRKFRNLADCEVLDLIDKDRFLEGLEAIERPEVIFHLGACSDTMEWDGRYLLETNYEYSKTLLAYCSDREIPLIYASSAAVYGLGPVFREERPYERPLNMYAYSKLLFDQHVRRVQQGLHSQVVGLRYFNVYGPRESHKGEMVSVAYKLHHQLLDSGRVQLFEGSEGYADGEHLRDFVWVGDVVNVTLWFWEHPDRSGVFNVGTGRSQTFNDVARAVIAHHARGKIEYIPFPEKLKGRYQTFTQADISALRKAGYDASFLTVEEAVPLYLRWLEGR
jgi:ADP-L-glycero-D-manno-heptose 6-epimerase